METPIVITLIASATVILTLIAKLVYSSKCKEVSCCCCKVIRDTDNEASLRSIAISNNPPV